MQDVDLIFFVSGAAVRAFGEQLHALGLTLSPSVQLAAVGQSTASEITRVFGRHEMILPAPGETEDSESLWNTIQVQDRLPVHVLIVRGQSGRDWLAQQMRRKAIEVTVHAAYCRSQATWDDSLVAQLRDYAQASHPVVIVCTSEQGIVGLVQLFKQHHLDRWCRGAAFVVTHARHREVLVDQFLFSDTEKERQIFLSGIQDDDLIHTIRRVCQSISSN